MRQRLLSYFTAAFINLAIVGGTHVPTLAKRPAIVRLQERAVGPGGFDRGELSADARVVVVSVVAQPHAFSPN